MRPVERRPPRPAGRPPAAALLALALGAPPGLAACAYRLERQDVFTFESPRQGPPPLSPAAAAAGWTVVPLDASLDGRPLAAFVASRPGATATLLFLNGRGAGGHRFARGSDNDPVSDPCRPLCRFRLSARLGG